jgi:beta-glucanase (GH16 family)
MAIPDLSQLRLTFDDEFDTFSNAPDGATGTWMTTYPYSGNAARTLSGNSEAEYYADSSVGANPFSLSGGVLQITASPTPAGVNTGGLPYVSGLITTDTSFSQTYGYFEVRAQLPAGRGLWPAFWLLPASNSYTSELDVFEVLSDQPAVVYSSVHGGYASGWATDIRPNATPDTSDGFHTFGVDWEPDTTSFYMDGRLLSTAATPDSMNTPMFMLLNLAVGGNGSWPGAPDGATVFPAAMKIDYVRAYATANTRDASGSALVGAAPGGAVTLGSGPDQLTLSISEDGWQGDARFTISIDGTRIGGVQTVTASRGAAVQSFNILGSFGPGRHGVVIDFINDAYGTGAGTDRNLFVESATLNGAALPGAALSLFGNGQQAFSFAGTGIILPTVADALPVVIGSGADTLALTMSEDAWLGDATFTISVDGQQIGGTLTALAAHGGTGQVFTVKGNFGLGLHSVRINFTNDAYGGTGDTDRNLYIDRATFNGIALPGSTVAVISGEQGFSFIATQSATRPAATDFNNDGRSDILWQNDDGGVAAWLIAPGGGSLAGSNMIGTNPGPSWHIKANGDLNGDGHADIVWQHDSGLVVDWLMNADGTGIIGGGVLGDNPGPNWHVVGSADFNGDGHADILLQHDNGTIVDWLVNADGTALVGGYVLGPYAGPTWHVVATGDSNGDTHPDILLQNDSGMIVDWLVNADGTGVTGGYVLGDPGSNWHVRGAGDFNGDGRSDVLLQHDNGTVVDWLVNADGTGLLGGYALTTNPGSAWHVKGTADFNGDGRADILLQHDNGSVVDWLVNADGSGLIGGYMLGTNPGQAWHATGSDNMHFIYANATTPLSATSQADEFVLNTPTSGQHVINGFAPLQDILELSALHFSSFADVQAHASTAGGGTLIALAPATSVLLTGVAPGSLQAHNFIFG